MRAAHVQLGALTLLICVLSVQSLPVSDSSRYNEPGGWPERTHHGVKKRGRPSYVQDTMNEDLEVKHNPHHMTPTMSRNDASDRPRCGVPDYPPQKGDQRVDRLRGQHRRKRYVLHGGRWDKTDLTYKIVRPPWQMSLEKTRQVFEEAWRVWSDVTPLTFTEVTRGKSDIVIDFTRYTHGDNLPFDGPGGILAHAFFPKTHRQGDIHFDYDEAWTVGNDMGTDLLQVAAHEFGHVLGLQHSWELGAVMSPFYSFSYPLELSEDDKMGIQLLYGPKKPSKKPVIETNELPNSVPDACFTDFDAVSMIRGELFFFKSGYVWRIRDGKLQAGYPALASRHWRGIPDNIDAAFEDRVGNIWFFQGQNYWIFDGEKQISGPDPVSQLRLPVDHIKAALLWGENKAQRIYFFKEGSYWRFNPQNARVDSSHARSMTDWRGIPPYIDAAFQDNYGFAHFLKGNQYWKFDPVEVRALEGYPRYIGMDFFGCSASIYS